MEQRLLFVRLSLLVAIALLAAGQPAAADPTPPTLSQNETLADTTANITDSLTALDLEVREGYFQAWGIEQCPPTFELMGTCYFNNPTAPYILTAVPYWDDEFVDPATKGVFGQTPEGYGTTFRFDPHEAILIFGYLPPPAHYFGLQTYTFSHKGKYDTNSETYTFFSTFGGESAFFHEIPLNPKRIGFMNSLSDSINNVMIERQSGASWDQFRYFIITPDGHMEHELRQALGKLGVDDSEIFTQRIPENVRVGLQKNADDFLAPLRYSMPLDGGGADTPSDQWRHSPTLRVLRVRDTSPGYPKEPFPAWTLDSYEARTAAPEEYLKGDLTKLVYAVADAWEQPCEDEACAGRYRAFGDIQTPPMNIIGALCSEIGMDCAGDAWDASYGFCPGITFDDGEVWAVIGTLGTATGNATYSSVGVNNFRLRLGVKAADYPKLVGSAAPYEEFEGDPANLDKLFVYYFARNCKDIESLTHGYCTEVEDTPLALPEGDRAAFTERDYIKPGTQWGPDSAQLLPSRALKLTRP
jgi:hypothetical protein